MPKSVFDFEKPLRVWIEQDRINFEFELMTVDNRRINSALTIPAFPQQFLGPIGACLIQWGAFEEFHETLLRAAIEFGEFTYNVPQGFKSKNKLLKKVLKSIFGQSSRVSMFYDEIDSKILPIYTARNMIAHGQLWCQVKMESPDGSPRFDLYRIQILARGYVNRNISEIIFEQHSFEDIFYGIANLTGDMMMIRDDFQNIMEVPEEEMGTLNQFREFLERFIYREKECVKLGEWSPSVRVE